MNSWKRKYLEMSSVVIYFKFVIMKNILLLFLFLCTISYGYSNTITVYGKNMGTESTTTSTTTPDGTTTTTTTTKIDCDNWYQDKCYTISSVGPVTSKLEVFDGNEVVFTKIGTINNYTTVGNSGVIVWK
jgi:hypothetical protein